MAISATTGSAASSASAVSSLALPSFNLTAAQAVIVGVVLGSTSISVSSITDTHGNTYTLISSVNGTGVRAELWACASVGAQTANIITVHLSGSTSISAQAEEYAGVTAISGIPVTNTGTAQITPNVFAATTQTNNFIAGVLGFVTGASTTQTAITGGGTSRQASIAASSVGGALYDNTVTGSATIPLYALLNAVQNFAAVAVELQSGTTATTWNIYPSGNAASMQQTLDFIMCNVNFPDVWANNPQTYVPVPVAVVLKGGTVGTAYSETITTANGTSPFTYAVILGSLPTSLILNTSTGVISGTPTVAGTYSFTIQSTDANLFIGATAFQITIATPSGGGGAFISLS